MVVTVAAGNAGLERWHATGDLPDQAWTELRWRTMPEDPTDSFMEIWFDANDPGSHAEVWLQVIPPRGRPTNWLSIGAGSFDEIVDLDGRLMGAVVGRVPKAGGNDGMFLIAIGPAAGTRRMAPAGLWRVMLCKADQGVPARFDAWIQRDEPSWSARPSVQSFFGGAAGGLSNLASGRETVVVGATSAEDCRMTPYSSTGGAPRRDGQRRRDVDTVAPADESRTEVGLLAAGVPSFSLTRMGGTSVAAPTAARRIYDDLARRARTYLAGNGQTGKPKPYKLSPATVPVPGGQRLPAYVFGLLRGRAHNPAARGPGNARQFPLLLPEGRPRPRVK